MSDDPPDDRDGSRTMTSFEEWIEQQAETQGVSRQELFEQLVSSYWTVNEMAELIDDPGDDAALPTSVPGDSGGDQEPDADADPGPDSNSESESDPNPASRREDAGSELEDIDSFEELRERLESLEAESEADRSADRSRDELIETLADRLTWLEADLSSDRAGGQRSPESASFGMSDPGSGRRSPATAELRDRIDALGDRLDAIEDDLADEQERTQSQDEFLEAVAERLSRIDARVDDLASETAADRESLADRVAEVESEVDDLNGEIESVRRSLTDRVDDLEADVEGRQKKLANEQERLRSRVDAEFDDLETILEYLVDRTDDLDAGVGAVEQRHDDDLSRLRWERESLQSVLADAAELDVRAGECEACGERVDFGLLAEPYCPACDSLLTGVEERDKWVFLSNVVVTAEENPSRGDGRTGPADGSGLAEPPRDGGDEPDAPGRAGGGDRDRPAGGRRPDGTDSTRSADAAADEPTDSQFSFGDLGSGAAGDDSPGQDFEAPSDDPFGDLTDLEREERRNDEE